MKSSEISIGHIYFDGKRGARKALSFSRDAFTGIDVVRYEILAAAQATETGAQSTMSLMGFASWAKTGMTEPEAQFPLLQMQAARVELSPGERKFMESLMGELEFEGITPAIGDLLIEANPSERRSVTGLGKKGFLEIHSDGNGIEVMDADGRGRLHEEVKLTPLGVAWLFANTEPIEATTQAPEAEERAEDDVPQQPTA